MAGSWNRAMLDWTPLERQVNGLLDLEKLPLTPAYQARVLGVTRTFIHRYRRDRRINVYTADKLSVRLGFHPASLWGDEWWDAAEYDMARRAELAARKRRRSEDNA